MAISWMSALVIATNDVEILSAGPDEHGKWQGIIAHSKSHPAHPYMPIISSAFYFDSNEDAEKAIRETVEEIRKKVNAEEKKSLAKQE